MKRRSAALLVLLAVAHLGSGRALAQGDPCRVPGSPRVVAVGDVHGAYDSLVRVLRFAGIVDEKARWAGGAAHLVQTGDLLDRGKDTRPVLELLMRLEGQARKAGGRVHALLGNHEVMNLVGDFRDVSPEEYEAFLTPASRERRERFYEIVSRRARDRARAAGDAFDEAAYRARFEREAPLGFVERVEAFSAEGRYGRWLRRRPVIVRINGVVFVHGGLTPEVAALGCEAVNAAVRREITDDIATARLSPQETLSSGVNGPLWFRGLAKEDETAFLPSVERVLESLGARAIVVGHTVTGTGRVQPRFGGRVILNDVGMGEVYGGNLAAVEVGPDGVISALYPERREELLRPAADRRPPAAAPAAALRGR
jgi:hypothetical protein